MRKSVVALLVLLAVGMPRPATAKLPYFSMKIAPADPAVGARVVVTMRCWEDERHTRPWTDCMGAGSTMAWLHPLDLEGDLDRRDWIPVRGHRAQSGATRGSFTVLEPGLYVLRPLWKSWRAGGHGFARPVQFLVPHPPFLASIGSAAVRAFAIAWRTLVGNWADRV